MRHFKFLMSLLALAITMLAGQFANAEFVGFGSITRGADDCPTGAPEIYTVTNLNNSGTGSFRDAVSIGCRHVVFDVGGAIDLTSTLQISESYITIDGSTAPSPGITLNLLGQRLALEARNNVAVHDIIVTHVRSVGNGQKVETKDLWELDGSSGAPVYNIFFDHMTMTAAGDGSVDMYGDVYNVTLSNSLLTDAMVGQHYSGSSSSSRDAITIYRNVFARMNERQPKIVFETTRIELVNNVVYGWGWIEGGASGLHFKVDGFNASSGNIENNIYHYVSGLHGSENNAVKIEGALDGNWFFADNSFPAGETQDVSTSGQIAIPAEFKVIRLPVSALADTVVPCAGTHFPTAAEINLLTTISQEIGGSGTSCVPPGPRPKSPTNLQIN